MSMTIAELAALAAQTDNQTETTSGGDFEYELPPEGRTVGRFIEYIEIGKQKQKPYLGKPKPDADEVYLGFELLHPKKNIKEIEVNGEKRQVADFIRVKVGKKLGEKAKFKKFFIKMTYGRDKITHMAQMLGEAFIIDVVHNKSEDGKKTYANIEKDGEILIQSPFVIDPMTEEKKAITVPANIKPIKLFIWDHANKESWDSLFIDGTKVVKEEGKPDREVSKNWLQEKIQGAVNYNGSPLNVLLSGLVDLKVTEDKHQGNAESTSTTTSPSEDALKQLADSKGPSTATTDDLAELGLS